MKFTLLSRVVPDPGLDLDGGRGPLAKPECDGLGIGADEAGGGGMGAVDEQLHLRPLAPPQACLEARRDYERDPDRAPLQGGLDLARAREGRRPAERIALPEVLGERPARARLVLIEDAERHVLDIERDRIAEDEQHHERHEERDPDRDRVAGDLLALLGDHRYDAPQSHGRPRRLAAAWRARSRSMKAMNTASTLSSISASSALSAG
jgi:hypothetical protein